MFKQRIINIINSYQNKINKLLRNHIYILIIKKKISFQKVSNGCLWGFPVPKPTVFEGLEKCNVVNKTLLSHQSTSTWLVNLWVGSSPCV